VGDFVKFTILILILLYNFSFNALALASDTKNLENDESKIAEYMAKCEAIKTLIVNKEYPVECFTNYSHFFPTNQNTKRSTAIKIANYNLLHPGTSKALFKDYAIVAKIMNQYDIVAALELLATVGRDEQSNKAVLDLIMNSPDMLAKLKEQRAKLTDPAKIQELEMKIRKLNNDTRAAYDLYRAPGYLKVLQELKKLDPSWGLILTPRGDSALEGSVEELAGYFYRGSTVSLAENPHCKKYAGEGAGFPSACFITLTEDFMGRSLVEHFARRPFMASFKVNNSKFTLVTSHIVFTYSGDEEAAKDLLKKTFGVESIKDLGPGINQANFARLAEVKNTLEFMEKYKNKYNDSKIMFLSDTNLVSSNAFWPQVLNSFTRSELLIKEPTTISPGRYLANGKETNGVANDYDHFILDKKTFSNCNDGEVYNYFKSGISSDIDRKYGIRQEIVGFQNKQFDKSFNSTSYSPLTNQPVSGSDVLEGDIPPVDDPATVKLDYPLTSHGQSKMDKFVSGFETYLKGLKTIKNNQVAQDDFQIPERLDGLRRRVFLRQLTNPYYNRHMQEILSDHFPVALTCQF